MSKIKIINENELIKLQLKFKKLKKKIGLCHGVFDLIHLGHIRHFEQAKKMVDFLFVSLTSDKFIYKGPGRPIFNQLQRAETLASLSFIDYIFISDNQSGVKSINLLKPKFYFKGPDYKNNKKDITGKIYSEKKSVIKNGGKIYYTSGRKYSSTVLINENLNLLSENQKNTIKDIKKKYSFEEITKLIKKLDSVKTLVIGETIIDQYNFTETLGKAGKDPILVLKKLYSEKYLGGAGAICKNILPFSKKIKFLTYLGENDEEVKFVKNKLSKNIKFEFISKTSSPTIIKERFVDYNSKHKIIGAYSINDSLLSDKEEKKIKNKFDKFNKDQDLTIVSDYGHGLISKKFAKHICKNSRFLALNVQINSSNIGYHSLKNYSHLKCIIINENELRYELRSKSENIERLLKKLSNDLKTEYAIVTRGISGAILYHSKYKKFYYSDAFSKNVVDKVGAGDTMLAIISMCLSKNIDCNLALLISSLCAAQSVSTIANKFSINREKLLKDLQHYLI